MAERPQLNVPLDKELLLRLKIVAAKKGTPVAQIIREFVEWYVAKEEAE